MDPASGLAPRRDQNVDLLRTAAILMVLVYHWFQRWPVRQESVRAFTELGQYGVDLFFVISGWLIGGLYWRELRDHGKVSIRRFLLRRWLRTIPPYLVALFLAWGGVALVRKEPFDAGYLLFLQNYYQRLPFFLVSWSLCVEEHFYLVLPFALWMLCRIGPRVPRWLPLAGLIPLGLRLVQPIDLGAVSFGQYETATHLRFEGLALGVWAAWVAQYDRPLWLRLKQLSRLLAPPAGLLLLALALVGPGGHYRFGYSLVALVFVVWVVRLADEPAFALPGLTPVLSIATWSYSLYLTHTFVEWPVLDVLRHRYPGGGLLYAPVLVLATFVAGAVFHAGVEAPAMRFRDRWVPRPPKGLRAPCGQPDHLPELGSAAKFEPAGKA